MSRVLIVARNPAMAMGLSATDYDVTDLRPEGLVAWIDGTDDADAVILVLESPLLATAAVHDLRARGKRAPVLLVSSDRPGWNSREILDLRATEVLPLPIRKQLLLSALQGLLSARATPTTSTFFPDEAPHHAVHLNAAAALEELRREDDAELFNLEDDLDSRIDLSTRIGPNLPSRASATPRSKPRQARRAARSEPPPAPKAPRRPASRKSEPPKAPLEGGPIQLVQDLFRKAHLLYGVPETADVTIADAVRRTGADAGALLVPDGAVWRVAGGSGLRPLEHRYELHAESWLVCEIAMGRKGALIEESDIAPRAPAGGAPGQLAPPPGGYCPRGGRPAHSGPSRPEFRDWG